MRNLVLASYEALANAIEHAYPEQGGHILLTAQRTDHHVMITITDHGRWRTPSPGGYRGRGLLLMRELADEMHLSVDQDHPGTTVRLRWHLEKPHQ